eukprot:scaffold11629_cov63-Phaeocystis_antarctica.AAC.8
MEDCMPMATGARRWVRTLAAEGLAGTSAGSRGCTEELDRPSRAEKRSAPEAMSRKTSTGSSGCAVSCAGSARAASSTGRRVAYLPAPAGGRQRIETVQVGYLAFRPR